MRGVGLVLAIVSGLAGLGCEEPIPEHPTFTENVGPLFHARCVRCHGAGGTLNTEPALAKTLGLPTAAFLDQFEDSGDCTPQPPDGSLLPTCHQGAHTFAQTIHIFIHLKGADRMPPPPAQGLTDWELTLVDRWAADPLP